MKCGKYKIDLGCGPARHKGYIGLDKHDYSDRYPKNMFIQWDLEKGALPFCENSVKEVIATSVFEHIHNFLPLMNDLWRVMKEDSFMYILVPRAGGTGSFKDPTHCRFFMGKTFQYFVRGTRQENYDLKPWFIIHCDEWRQGMGTIEVIMVPDKRSEDEIINSNNNNKS